MVFSISLAKLLSAKKKATTRGLRADPANFSLPSQIKVQATTRHLFIAKYNTLARNQSKSTGTRSRPYRHPSIGIKRDPKESTCILRNALEPNGIHWNLKRSSEPSALRRKCVGVGRTLEEPRP